MFRPDAPTGAKVHTVKMPLIAVRFLPLCLAAALGLATTEPAAAQPWTPPPDADRPPMPIITDTPEYCAFLAAKIRAMQRTAPVPSPDVRLLAFEGRRLCEHGQVRAGVMRMRMAWRLLTGG